MAEQADITNTRKEALGAMGKPNNAATEAGAERDGIQMLAELQNNIATAVQAVRDNNPMAGSVTNGVTMDFVANAQLAVGGSAAMVYLPDEGEFLVDAGGAVYLNMGTLLPVHEQTMVATAKHAHETNTPWVLDPVGIGIGQLRTNIMCALKEYKPAIVRGNASEIIAVAQMWGLLDANNEASGPRGVDTTDEVAAAKNVAVALARYTGGAVAVSGEEDLATDGTVVAYSAGGSALMSKVTGFGCSLGGVMAVYATQASPFIACVASMAHYNVAGMRAAAQASAPASFKVAFIDELYNATAKDIANNPLRIEVEKR